MLVKFFISFVFRHHASKYLADTFLRLEALAYTSANQQEFNNPSSIQYLQSTMSPPPQSGGHVPGHVHIQHPSQLPHYRPPPDVREETSGSPKLKRLSPSAIPYIQPTPYPTRNPGSHGAPVQRPPVPSIQGGYANLQSRPVTGVVHIDHRYEIGNFGMPSTMTGLPFPQELQELYVRDQHNAGFLKHPYATETVYDNGNYKHQHIPGHVYSTYTQQPITPQGSARRHKRNRPHNGSTIMSPSASPATAATASISTIANATDYDNDKTREYVGYRMHLGHVVTRDSEKDAQESCSDSTEIGYAYFQRTKSVLPEMQEEPFLKASLAIRPHSH